jgi:pimeloyl-ACP methyl ester carboxylesterase
VHVDEHTITLDESPAFYRSAPATGVPPLYLHGVPTSSDDFIVFLERTGGIAADLIGFGRSSKAGHLDYSIAGMATFVERLLDELGIEEVQLVGHDWGAAVGVELAARVPQRLERLVLCNPLPLVDGFHWHRLARRLRSPVIGELLMGATTRRLLARILRRGSANPEAWPDERIHAVWSHFDQGTQRAILRLLRATDESTRLNVVPITEQALIIWGEQDPWCDPALADRYAAQFPGARVKRLPQAGHWPWLDDPGVIETVAEFLR